MHRFLAAGIDVDIRDTVRLKLVFLCVVSGVIIDTSFLSLVWSPMPKKIGLDRVSYHVCVCVSYGVNQIMCNSVHDAWQTCVQVTSSMLIGLGQLH